MKRNAVIFDLNGVILFDTPLQWHAWNRVLEDSGREPVQEAVFREQFNGRTSREMIAALWGRGLSEQRIHFYQSEKQHIYRDLCEKDKEHFCLAPGLGRYLDDLKRLGIPFTIATSASRYSVNFYYQNLGLNRWLDRESIVSGEDVKRGKPAPDLFRTAAKRLHTAPENCLVFEDTNAGVRAANHAGIGKVIVIDPDGIFCPESSLRFDAVYPNFRAVFVENTVAIPQSEEKPGDNGVGCEETE